MRLGLERGSMQPPRFAARSRILYDLTISEGARLLYLALDDQAMGESSVLLNQERQIELLGRKEREIRLRIGELVRAGYVRIQRTGRSNVYEFVWKIPAQACRSDRHRRAAISGDTGTGVPIVSLLNQERQLQERTDGRFAENQRQTPVTVATCPSCRGNKRILIPAVGWSDCTPCRGTGRQAERRAS